MLVQLKHSGLGRNVRSQTGKVVAFFNNSTTVSVFRVEGGGVTPTSNRKQVQDIVAKF